MRLGIDLGGTKIAAIVLADDGGTVWETRTLTPRNDYDRTIEVIRALIGEGERAARVPCSVGIGMPGAISPVTGLVKNANSTWLNGRPFLADVQARLGRDVRLANDANCLAVSEATDGAAAGAHVVFGVILGTGVGGGVAVDGRVVTGPNAIAGEWGHNPLPWAADDERPGPDCYCGRRGCIETFLSGPGLAAEYQRQSGRAGVTSETLVADAEGGEPNAIAVFDQWIERLSRSLATIINVLDPDALVIGGGLSRLDRVYRDVPQAWGRWVFSDRVDTQLVPAKWGDASGVRGAAMLWPHPMLPSS